MDQEIRQGFGSSPGESPNSSENQEGDFKYKYDLGILSVGLGDLVWGERRHQTGERA